MPTIFIPSPKVGTAGLEVFVGLGIGVFVRVGVLVSTVVLVLADNVGVTVGCTATDGVFVGTKVGTTISGVFVGIV